MLWWREGGRMAHGAGGAGIQYVAVPGSVAAAVDAAAAHHDAVRADPFQARSAICRHMLVEPVPEGLLVGIEHSMPGTYPKPKESRPARWVGRDPFTLRSWSNTPRFRHSAFPTPHAFPKRPYP